MAIRSVQNAVLMVVLGTPNPAPYANAITYAYLEMRVRRVILLYIEGDAAALTRLDADALSKKIWDEIDKWELLEEKKPGERMNLYSNLKRDIVNRGVEALHIASIVQDLSNLVRRHYQEIPILDITGATKVSGVDALAAAALLNLGSHSFELTKAGHGKPPEFKSFSFLSKDDYTYEDLLHRSRVSGALGSLSFQSRSLWVITLSCVITAACLAVLAAWSPMNGIITLVGLLSSVIAISQIAISSFFKQPRW
jgi:hypothetical protein